MIYCLIVQMNAMKAANKELKGMMKTVKIEDIDVCHFDLVVVPCMVSWVLCCYHSGILCISLR
jgi:hypothetical protein